VSWDRRPSGKLSIILDFPSQNLTRVHLTIDCRVLRRGPGKIHPGGGPPDQGLHSTNDRHAAGLEPRRPAVAGPRQTFERGSRRPPTGQGAVSDRERTTRFGNGRPRPVERRRAGPGKIALRIEVTLGESIYARSRAPDTGDLWVIERIIGRSRIIRLTAIRPRTGARRELR
jgi:hypothetical protein